MDMPALESPGAHSPLLHADRPPWGQPWHDANACEVWHTAMAAYMERQEPTVQALVEAVTVPRWPRAVGAMSGPLPHLSGLTVGVKDVFHVRGFTTRAGTSLPPSLLQGHEASVVSRLRMAGAHVVGKTVTTEFAYFEPGPTTNPWHPAYTPGGSSSGSAAGVAAGLFDVGLGTQTVGSVIRPASFCGILGYKPSLGRIARDGLLLYSDTVDHVGLMTRDWTAMLAVAPEVVDGWQSVQGSLQPVFGLLQDEYLTHATPAMAAHVRDWSQRLAQAGFVVKPMAVFHDFGDLVARHTDLIAYEFSRRHRAWFERFEALYRPRTAQLIRSGLRIPQSRWHECSRSCPRLRQRIHGRMQEEQVDILISPAAVTTASHGLRHTGDPVMNLPWTHAGVPAITMPMGLAADARDVRLPAGVQLTAAMGQDELLLGCAHRICEALPPLARL